MVIKMPYGVVSIDNEESAVKFVKDHCKDCPYSIGSFLCSGEQASMCSVLIDQVIQQYRPKKHIITKDE